MPASGFEVTLANCDSEPIHIPGTIQGHGALLAFDMEGRLSYRSDNVSALLFGAKSLEIVTAADLDGNAAFHKAFFVVSADARAALAAGDTRAEVAPLGAEVQMRGNTFDMVVHAYGGQVIAEFEPRTTTSDNLSAFALMAHRAVASLKRRREVGPLLADAVEVIRTLTGFNRVMAYRFHADDSGEVVAEARSAELDPYLGMRYPASDIPAQARRLYVINTLRVISSVAGAQVPVRRVAGAGAAAPPLDMSHCGLRSVSPIHLEYLGNMGVAASMSISIVVGGRLWGLIACHHMRPLRVPYSVRMACDVLAQVIGIGVQSHVTREAAVRHAAASPLHIDLIDVVLREENILGGLARRAPDLAKAVAADAVLIALGDQLSLHRAAPAAAGAGPATPEEASAGAGMAALVYWLNGQPGDLLALDRPGEMPAQAREAMAPYHGLMACRIDSARRGWIVWLRLEQVETLRWGGRPEKEVVSGPRGPRLTPRGSFDEWRETVRGITAPWSAIDREIGKRFLDELGRATFARAIEMDRARMQLLAVLSHDLRDPLNAISLQAQVLKDGLAEPGYSVKAGQRIAVSTGRMERLITQVLDMSRIQGGLGLNMQASEVDLSALLRELIDASGAAYAETPIETEIAEHLQATVDPDRFAQLAANLIGNARDHGKLGTPVKVRLARPRAHQAPGAARLEVRNVAPPIPPDIVATLYNPLKRRAVANPRNRTGLGLGLYIVREIVDGHGGSIDYSHEDGEVVFAVTLPEPGEA
ncbi:MAG: hypothetical protein JWN73_1703 [Betaproteobacteria bacterium]|nr:hypothetical protein [Betaproteobacteria bacterium]